MFEIFLCEAELAQLMVGLNQLSLESHESDFNPAGQAGL